MTRLRISRHVLWLGPIDLLLWSVVVLWVLVTLGAAERLAHAQPAPATVQKPKPAVAASARPPGVQGQPRPAPTAVRPGVGGPARPGGAPQPGGPINQALARLITQATTAMAAQDYATAYRSLVQAYAMAPGTVLFHLGALAAAEQRQVEARDLWRRFLADPTVDPASPLRAEAQQKLEQLPIIEAGEVVIGAPRGTQVHIDGKLVGTVPLSAPILAQTGRHRVAVNQGRWAAETEVQVRTARQSEVRFKAGSDVAVVTLPSAVLYCDPSGLDPAVTEPIFLAVETAAKRENYALLPRWSALSYARDVAACQGSDAAACCEELARRYAADYLLDVRVKRDGNEWQLEAQLRDMQVEDMVGSAAPSCSGCSPDKVALKLGEATTQLLGQAASRGRGTLEVSSTPVGAEVFLSGRRVGVTPYQHAMWTGSYQLEVKQPGFVSQQLSVDVQSDKPAQVAVTLEREQAIAPQIVDKPQAKKRPAWRYAVGAVTLGAGLVMVGFGAAGLAANGSCAVDEMPPNPCPRAYNTTGVGAGLVGAGGALSIAGIVIMAWPPR